MNKYQTFLKIVELGSFTDAARELNYSQSAISHMIHSLEECSCTVRKQATENKR